MGNATILWLSILKKTPFDVCGCSRSTLTERVNFPVSMLPCWATDAQDTKAKCSTWLLPAAPALDFCALLPREKKKTLGGRKQKSNRATHQISPSGKQISFSVGFCTEVAAAICSGLGQLSPTLCSNGSLFFFFFKKGELG